MPFDGGDDDIFLSLPNKLLVNLLSERLCFVRKNEGSKNSTYRQSMVRAKHVEPGMAKLIATERYGIRRLAPHPPHCIGRNGCVDVVGR